ncbi:glycosyl hydrolase [Paraburkholderia guartelaensis]|uniref:Glycosyl hydrolase n=1 Tax=Paraburkholderia guartelaensis TaxID=2546446 RepID=A0A4R5L2Q5_9BURK|nr:YCF48-related protein [Paraburkholderia guartelaensis]TDG02877.1 glycosyl hydrolase [Paraburkholderia guartelaensis]
MKDAIKLKAACGVLAVLAGLYVTNDVLADTAPRTRVVLASAKHLANADQSMMLGATLAGSRIVAVGEHGVILLSDDNGAHFHQANEVPANATLTSVAFADAQHGWAAGHWGVILRTDDGGENWHLQRADAGVDQPLFSIAFRDASNGWAVGLWSLVLRTNDGGKTWAAAKREDISGAGKGGLNLYTVFPGGGSSVFAVGERGTVLRSKNNGQTWDAKATDYNGTLWSGTMTRAGMIYVAGLRGHIFSSIDGGDTWTPVASGTDGSITDLVAEADSIAGVSLDGDMILARDREKGFQARKIAGHDGLTAVVFDAQGRPVIFAKDGVVAP